ncbi:MAG: HU family DNA-binding protein [candidate division KSB1 bacterium]|nr:HU family DNA-binding protein [candidate division KSB1 bacterium]MDZ7334290.1 HU family DNA-binding protein [candidate division KSB1 bacterium]MDZ7356492.1 HU family DNA-binding protein [candidate division KSB1 bacterium]MDZ7377011.1 HU family DNA-binding protein [candidate division KSB1 bacterium]MDZ7400499.1 HU family DNA-binding protein [candidate division KSB1 bacterium]
MTKADLIDKVAEVEGIPSKKVAGEAVDAVFHALKDALVKGDSFTYQGFGTFKVQQYAARSGVNLKTKKKIQIPATKRPKFVPSKTLKDAVK